MHVVLDVQPIVLVHIVQQALRVVLHAIRNGGGQARPKQPRDGAQERLADPADHRVALQLNGNVTERHDAQLVQHQVGLVQIQRKLAGHQRIGDDAGDRAAGVHAEHARRKVVAELRAPHVCVLSVCMFGGCMHMLEEEREREEKCFQQCGLYYKIQLK